MPRRNQPKHASPGVRKAQPLGRCTKTRYASKSLAEKAASREPDDLLVDKPDLDVYLCVQCGGWHLTSRQ